ncbi:GNAT superfamily N-acetyltransferase [Arthrobacter sp. 2762]
MFRRKPADDVGAQFGIWQGADGGYSAGPGCLGDDGKTASRSGWIRIRPGLRGQGLGSALLEAAYNLVRSRSGALLEINVDGEDTDARRFYEAHGFANTEPNRVDPMLYYYREL